MDNYQQRFVALGSEVVLTLVSTSRSDAEVVFARLREEIEIFEVRFSRFRPTSELSYVNAEAGKRTAISREFVSLLGAALEQAKQTNGLFNPLILPKLQKAGYVGSWTDDPTTLKAPVYSHRRLANASEIQLGDDWVQLPAESALDFGGIGKGYLLNQLGQSVGEGFHGYWFSLGGDIVMSGRDKDNLPWAIGVQHATDLGRNIGSFGNNDGETLAVATSGVTKRRGVTGGKAWHHIIDPRTGESAATDLLTVTVCAGDATQADVLAKCAVILGSSEAWNFLKLHGVRGAIMQRMGDNSEVNVIKREMS
jgi:thiamine biosynthesis lipoprotein